MKNTLIVNLFGEPGAGKSTAAAYIFSKLKMAGISADYVTEFAKDKVWENNEEVFKHQTYLFGKQHYKIARVCGKVDVIITDSPILLSAVYNTDPCLGEQFNDLVARVFKSYSNLNILLYRTHPYEDNGRNESETEARKVREVLIATMKKYGITYDSCSSIIESYDILIESILDYINDENTI